MKSQEARLRRWKEHFQEILNRDTPEEPPQEEEEEIEELDIQVEAPTIQEIKRAVKDLRNGKASGADQITAEMLKADTEQTSKEMKRIFDLIWEKEKIPTQWTKGLICKIPKKGNLQECGNWRGVTLLPLASKVLSKMTINRIQTGVDSSLRKAQAGFRAGRGTVGQIFILRNILEQVSEWNATLYVHFVDFEKAFDSIHRDSLWIIMRHYGIPQKLIQMVKTLYEDFQCSVIVDNETTDWFPVITRVKQRCCMSGFLFLLIIDWVMRKTVEVKNLTTKCEDLEGRQRRNNIRLFGVPEGIEGPRPTEFVSELLQELLRLEQKPILDRAHRSLRAKPKSSEPPWPFIIRVHLYQTRYILNES
ncbi:hypothetical protein NFI96_006075 [Prochilodus magdalenae]|nr:hypothetical protein NFI96_006075 [Prochilodus magdalenae]